MRLRTSLPFFALIALVGAPSLARPAEKADSRAPALVVRVKPIADIMADLEFLSREAGHEDQGKKANDQMKAFGGKAVDTSRPWGAYAAVGDDLSDVAVVGLVPVAGEKEFQELLERYNLKAEKGDDGISTLNLPLVPVPIYFRVQDHYAYVTARTKGPLAKDRLLDPSKIFTGEGNELVYASFRLDRLPDTVRELALQFIDQGAAKAKEEEQAGETKTQREFRTQALDDLARRVGQILKEGREIRLRLGVDRSAHELTADLDATAKPDTDLARDIAAAGQSSSQFGSLASGDAAISLVVHASLSESMRKALAPVIDEGLREGAKKAKDDAHRQQAEKFLKALEPTLKAGVLDVAFTLRPAGEEHFSMIAAIKVKDGEELEKSVRDLVQTVPEKDRDKIKLDAESIGSVKVHRVDAQGGFDADAKRLFGDNPLYFAFRSDAFSSRAVPTAWRPCGRRFRRRPRVSPRSNWSCPWPGWHR